MISFVRGTLAGVSENKIEIDTGALGYEVNVPASVLDELPPIGTEVKVYTYLSHKEDEMSLFGFTTKDALAMFKLLINVNGIGPRGALGILSVFTPVDLRFAVLAGDAKAISRAPGIGPKTAQRLIIELKDKVSLEDGLAHFNDNVQPAAGKNNAADMSAKNEAVVALTVLGYSNSEALKAVQGIDVTGMTTEDILKAALKKLTF